MSHILIVDDAPLERELLGRLLRVKGHTVATAVNGQEALAAMGQRTPDLVVLDLAMPQMDGLTFLQHMRASPASHLTPVVVLTGVMEPKVVRRVAQLGVQSYLLKSRFNWDELEGRIQKELGGKAPRVAPRRVPPPPVDDRTAAPSPTPGAATPVHAVSAAPTPPQPQQSQAPTQPPPLTQNQPLTREQMLAQVELHTASKSLAGVVAEVIGLTSSPHGSMADLITLIKRDAILASRVLQVANTAAFTTHKQRVTSVEEAVRNVGLSTVRNIATSVGIFDAFPPDAADGFNLLRCWQHSFAVATILERITAGVEGIPPGTAHVVGLCHDLVEIVLRQAIGDRYERAAADAATTGRPVAELQAASFGLPAHELAGMIVERMALPPAVGGPMRQYAELLGRPHHQQQGAAVAAAAAPLTHALRLADLYAHGLLLASSPHAVVAPFSQAECRVALNRPSPDPIDGAALRADVLSMTNLFARLPAKDEAKLNQPPYPRRAELSVWYARHRAYSPFDPLEAALAQLCSVRVADRLPQPEELSECDAIVIAALRPNLAGFRPEEVLALRAFAAHPAETSVLYLNAPIDDDAPPDPLGGGTAAPPLAQPVASSMAFSPLDARIYPIPISTLATFLASAELAK